ncbi:hypothetical protein FA15DRAFT_661091 [Coprinopsis marcescibilis]|uniref:Uncharacterized protein n=1 Tax=Coprinopsis marcescibilis TaxID=230819 RepID=A0A5C3KCY3_COPMA|nr:hypothetical protein FA15DRAFT_661091 [Coprinopsis marcescibilis]
MLAAGSVTSIVSAFGSVMSNVQTDSARVRFESELNFKPAMQGVMYGPVLAQLLEKLGIVRYSPSCAFILEAIGNGEDEFWRSQEILVAPSALKYWSNIVGVQYLMITLNTAFSFVPVFDSIHSTAYSCSGLLVSQIWLSNLPGKRQLLFGTCIWKDIVSPQIIDLGILPFFKKKSAYPVLPDLAKDCKLNGRVNQLVNHLVDLPNSGWCFQNKLVDNMSQSLTIEQVCFVWHQVDHSDSSNGLTKLILIASQGWVSLEVVVDIEEREAQFCWLELISKSTVALEE